MSENPEDSTFEHKAEFECAVCGTVHDEEIHEATLSIHRWFQHQVTHVFDDDALYMPNVAPNLAVS